MKHLSYLTKQEQIAVLYESIRKAKEDNHPYLLKVSIYFLNGLLKESEDDNSRFD